MTMGALESNAHPFGLSLLVVCLGGALWLKKRGAREAWPLLGLGALLLYNLLFSANFLSVTVRDGALYGTPVNLLNQGSVVMLLGLGMTFVIATAGIDLSVGSVMALSGAVAVVLMREWQLSFGLAATVALAVATLVGLLNGSLIALLGIQPIVATLISMVAGRGVAMLVTSAEPVSHHDPGFQTLGSGHFLGLPVTVWVVLAVFTGALLLSRKTALGLFVEATGDSEAACRMSGVPIRSIKLCVYAFSGLCAGIAGLIAASYIGTADPDRVGRMRELDAIFAVVAGGTALTGGRFYLAGTLVGALLIQALLLTMYSQNVPSEIEPMPKAIVMLFLCLLLAPKSRERVVRLIASLRPRVGA